MGISTFTGPLKAGNVLNTTGTTPGTVKNVGWVAMAQTASITQAGTAIALATGIVIPAYSHILNIQFLNTIGWNGTASTINIGTSATATELVSAVSLSAIGQVSAGPGTDATRTANWSNVGASDVIIYALSTNTGAGVGDLVVRYIQAENIT
jgi:hypothetical protein